MPPGEKINIEAKERTIVEPEVFEELKANAGTADSFGFGPAQTAQLIQLNPISLKLTNSSSTNTTESTS